MAELFGTKRPAITKHLNNIYKCEELSEESTCSILEHMGNDGKQLYSTLPPVEGIFYDGQFFDAYVHIVNLIKQAKQSIVLIDNYINETTLTMLSKRSSNVITSSIRPSLSITVSEITTASSSHILS